MNHLPAAIVCPRLQRFCRLLRGTTVEATHSTLEQSSSWATKQPSLLKKIDLTPRRWPASRIFPLRQAVSGIQTISQ